MLGLPILLKPTASDRLPRILTPKQSNKLVVLYGTKSLIEPSKVYGSAVQKEYRNLRSWRIVEPLFIDLIALKVTPRCTDHV